MNAPKTMCCATRVRRPFVTSTNRKKWPAQIRSARYVALNWMLCDVITRTTPRYAPSRRMGVLKTDTLPRKQQSHGPNAHEQRDHPDKVGVIPFERHAVPQGAQEHDKGQCNGDEDA